MKITKWIKPVWKTYSLYDSRYMAFWKRQDYGQQEISACRGVKAGREAEQGQHGGFLEQDSTLHNTITVMHVIMHPSKPTEWQHKEWALMETMDCSE